MKPFITTVLAFCAVACGSGGQAPAEFHAAGNPTTPANQPQTPQRPSDTVPPLSSQQPPANSQTPPVGSQTAGPASVKTITCAEATASVNKAGCTVSDNDAEYCETWSAPGGPCAKLLQGLLGCLMQDAVCDDEGHLDRDKSCPDQSFAMETCVETYDKVQVTDCSTETQCRNCADMCARCLCRENNAIDRCVPDCGVPADST